MPGFHLGADHDYEHKTHNRGVSSQVAIRQYEWHLSVPAVTATEQPMGKIPFVNQSFFWQSN